VIILELTILSLNTDLSTFCSFFYDDYLVKDVIRDEDVNY